MRARLAIAYSGISVELREVVLKDKPASLLAASPKGTVPVLITEQQTIIDESIDIMQWAIQQNDPDNWFQHLSLEQKQLGNELISYNDGEFKYYLDRYKYADRYPEQTEQFYREQGELFLQKLEQQLANQTYLLAPHITWADMAILPFIRQFASVDKSWFEQSNYPKVRDWLNTFIESDRFKQIMPKFKQWQSNQQVTLFPY
jgi:glutathione S-transferase